MKKSRSDADLIQDMGWFGRSVHILKPLSTNLRERLISSVEDGMSPVGQWQRPDRRL